MAIRVALYMFSVSLVILLGSWPASAQECPLLFSSTAMAPSQVYNYDSPAFESLSASLNRVVANYVHHHRITKYAVAVVHQDRTVFNSGLTSTPFRVASITKTITALGAFILRDRGQLSLDDPVKKFLPDFSIINPFGDHHDTTLRELMGHAAGFPQQLCPFLTTCTNDESEILKQISGMQLISPPWSDYPAYSNLGIALLGRAWEKAALPSKSWEEFVTDNILKPLRMTKSGVNVSGVLLAANSHPWALQDLGWSAPAAQMYSTADDLAKYLGFLLTAQPPLISTASLAEWMSPATIFLDGKGGFSFPWELQLLREKSHRYLITKSGNINGFLSHISLDPSTQLGTVVLTVVEEGISWGSADELAGNIMRTLIRKVQSVNQEMVADVYSGLYTCPRSAVFSGPTLNYSVEVTTGTINVSVSPDVGLLAEVSIDLLNGGWPVTAAETWALLPKDAAKNSFWFGNGSSCSGLVNSVSASPDLTNPNSLGSFYTNVIEFNPAKGSLKWPAVGASCYKAGFEPPELPESPPPASHTDYSFALVLFSFFFFSILSFYFFLPSRRRWMPLERDVRL